MSGNQTEKQQIIVFKLDDRHYGASIEDIREINRIGEISPVPNAPSFIMGITNRRGQVTTVIDLRTRLGFPSKELDQHSRMLVIESKSGSKGIVVDAVEDAVMLTNEEIEETPEIAKSTDESSNYVKGIGKKDQKLIIILDLKKVTYEEEDNVQLQVNTEFLQAQANRS